MLFTGLLVQIDTLPTFVQPFTYLSYFRLGFESLIITFYGFGRCRPIEAITMKDIKATFGDDIQPVMFCLNDYGLLDNITDKFEKFSDDYQSRNPSLVMDGFVLKDEDLYFNIAFMIGYAVVIRIIAFCVLLFRANRKK